MKLFAFLLSLLCTLSVFAQDEAIKKGTRVLLGDELGVVRAVNLNGTIRIEFVTRIKHATMLPSQVARRIETCKSKVCNDGRVSFGDTTGTVTDVFSNGVARIRLDGTYRVALKKVKELGVEVSCLGSLCKGEKVNFDNHDSGVAKEVFSNGNVLITIDDFLNRMLNENMKRETVRKIAELGHCE